MRLILGAGFLLLPLVFSGCSNEAEKASVAGKAGKGLPIENVEWGIYRGCSGLTGRHPDDAAWNGVDGAAVKAMKVSIRPSWAFRSKNSFKGTPVIGGGRVFIGSEDSSMFALALKDGALAWEFKASSSIEGSAAVSEGRLFFGTSGGEFYALDAEDGSEIWIFKPGDKIAGGVNVAKLADGRKAVLFGCYDGALYCLDAESGEKIWEHSTGNFINGTPAIDGGIVYFGGCDSKLRALELETGKLLHSMDAGSYLPSSPAVESGRVLAATYAGALICVASGTLEELWEYDDEENNPQFFSSPAVNGGVVMIGSRNSHLYAISLDGGLLKWKFNARSDIDTSVVVAGNRFAIFAAKDGRVFVVDVFDGSVSGVYDTGESIAGSPALAQGMIVLGTLEGTVFALETAGDAP